jgi:hypothetical protein
MHVASVNYLRILIAHLVRPRHSGNLVAEAECLANIVFNEHSPMRATFGLFFMKKLFAVAL